MLSNISPILISATSATFSEAEGRSIQSLAKLGISAGGMLSEQKKPISSSVLNALDLPAPERPVIIVSCINVSSPLILSASLHPIYR